MMKRALNDVLFDTIISNVSADNVIQDESNCYVAAGCHSGSDALTCGVEKTHKKHLHISSVDP